MYKSYKFQKYFDFASHNPIPVPPQNKQEGFQI